jgi:uncharacterized membrane protein
MRRYIRVTLLGGIAAVLPLALIIIVFRWLINLIERYLGPIVELFETESYFLPYGIYAILVVGIILSFFFIGIIIETRIGRFFTHVLEKNYLMKLPGYKIARETVMQFFGKQKSFFSEVVLVDLFNAGTLMTGFITDDQGEIVTVFVPTGPNPTSGNIYHVQSDKVLRTSAAVESGMRSIISCGAGSSEVFNQIKSPSDDTANGRLQPGS